MSNKILMHICCAPCSIKPIRILKSEGYIVDGLFFNPNIHPFQEFEKRKIALQNFQEIEDINIAYFDHIDEKSWENYDIDDESRCNSCYIMRLEHLFAYAKDKGYNIVTTSLLVSPYQKHDMIKTIAGKLSQRYNIQFLYRDFRDKYREGMQIARELKLYTQKYCGCIISRKIRENELSLKGKSL